MLKYTVTYRGGTAAGKTNFDGDWTGRGFLQTAFTKAAQDLIELTVVDNSVLSTNPANNPTELNAGVNRYACEDTKDKIFLLSTKEATDSDFGFGALDAPETDSRRIRVPTDYALAHCAYYIKGDGSWWWLRSPNGEDAVDGVKSVRMVNYDGSARFRMDVDKGAVSLVPALTVTLGE